MNAAMLDWTQALSRHGFERIYWLNGHGGNVVTIILASVRAVISEFRHFAAS